MFDSILKELENISSAVGIPVDYTQGGGGNTSVKLDLELMAVKASGFKLKQITPSEGYVVVNYKNIKNYYETADFTLDKDFEKDSADYVKANIVEIEGLKKLRPSVEAGFHSILKKFVIHTHPVYVNILCCTTNGEENVRKAFAGKDYEIVWIPYINPGFCLTLKMHEAIQECIKKTGKFPEVIFMENHGLVVTSDDSQKCVELHKEVNDTIKAYLGIIEEFPKIELFNVDENTVISKSSFLSDYFKGREMSAGFFDEIVLYPDQLVYLNGSVSVNEMSKKLNINTETGEIIYKTNPAEAQTIEETLLAYIYVVKMIKEKELPLKTMSEKEIYFIRNWESEAYRKSLVKELAK